MSLLGLQADLHATPHAATLDAGLDIISHSINQVRGLALELRPSLLDDFGLIATLRWLVQRQRELSNLPVTLVSNVGEQRFAPEIETAGFRVVQEALTNAARHAHAQHIEVEVCGDDAELDIQIRDDGAGFDLAAARQRVLEGTSLGLLSMQERVQLTGGELHIETAPGHGTTVTARFRINTV